jgi:hypothetical protein
MESSDESENENVDYARDEDVYLDEDWEDISDEEKGTEEVGISPYMYEPSLRQNSNDKSCLYSNDTPETSTSTTNNTNNASNEGIDERLGNTDWCMCGECRAMDAATDCICCREVTVISEELYESFHCISKAPEFLILCCRRSVLENVLACFGNIRGDSISINPENASLRYAAYRQYIWWIYKYLGPKNRRIIPSCVLWSIRENYPEESGSYIPFRFSEE